jgi:hypothetical protein
MSQRSSGVLWAATSARVKDFAILQRLSELACAGDLESEIIYEHLWRSSIASKAGFLSKFRCYDSRWSDRGGEDV